MTLLVELPTWLGDAVMATPALENLYDTYPEAGVTLVGSRVAVEALRAHSRVGRVVVDTTRSGGWRPLNLYRLAKELGPHDLAVSFRSHLTSRLLLAWTGSRKRHIFNKKTTHYPLSTTHSARSAVHTVEKYQAFVNAVTGRSDAPGPLRLDWPVRSYDRPTLGINPGATYGSAKRWYPDRFAAVAAAMAKDFDIIIFGGPGEVDIAGDIADDLAQRGVTNVTNLAGQTTIPQLCAAIGGLDLFITGDSGPMHVAAAYHVPTVALFGPTKHLETCQWRNEKSLIVRRDMACAPCMKRTCPLKHHACMKEITPKEVIEAARGIIETKKRRD